MTENTNTNKMIECLYAVDKNGMIWLLNPKTGCFSPTVNIDNLSDANKQNLGRYVLQKWRHVMPTSPVEKPKNNLFPFQNVRHPQKIVDFFSRKDRPDTSINNSAINSCSIYVVVLKAIDTIGQESRLLLRNNKIDQSIEILEILPYILHDVSDPKRLIEIAKKIGGYLLKHPERRSLSLWKNLLAHTDYPNIEYDKNTLKKPASRLETAQ